VSNSDAPRPLARIRQTEDPAVVVGVLLQLDELSLPELLARLETAVADERFADAESLLGFIQDRYQERAQTESQTRAKVQLSRTESVSDFAKSQNLTQYLQSATATSAQRTQLVTEVAAVIESEGDSGSISSAQQTIAATRQQERQFEQATQRAETATEEDSLPARVALTAVSVGSTQVAIESTTEMSITIVNAGDTPARDVEVRISAGDVTQIEQPAISVGTLDPDVSVNRTVTLRGARKGTGRVTVTATSANAGSTSESATVSVTGTETGTGEDTEPQSVVDEYDTNNDGEISIGEISTAAADFIDGNLSIQDISRIAAEFIN